MRFYIVDVFAERKYEGNQLAVFIPDTALATEEMQQIAREMNFSETTFIMSDRQPNGGYDVRIFTPGVEIPFAGHPTLGSAFVIQQLLEDGSSERVVLNLAVGQIPVTFQDGLLIMEQNQPVFGNIISDARQVADMLCIEESDIDTRYPIQEVSTGLPAVIVPLKSLECVGKCAIRHDRYRTFLQEQADANVLVFAPESLSGDPVLRARVFMNDAGYLEDPATGSANGNLAGYLLNYGYFQKNDITYRVKQGFEMGRPSLLSITAAKENDTYRIKVGGKAVLVAKGEWV